MAALLDVDATLAALEARIATPPPRPAQQQPAPAAPGTPTGAAVVRSHRLPSSPPSPPPQSPVADRAAARAASLARILPPGDRDDAEPAPLPVSRKRAARNDLVEYPLASPRASRLLASQPQEESREDELGTRGAWLRLARAGSGDSVASASTSASLSDTEGAEGDDKAEGMEAVFALVRSGSWENL